MSRLSFSPCLALLLSALVFLFPYGEAQARGTPKREVLRLAQDCPQSERLCLSAWLIWKPDTWGRVTYSTHGDTIIGPNSITRDIVVTARLNGGSPRVYVLRTDRPYDDFQNPENELGGVAFFGRSPANRPIIQTDRGRIEILTKTVDVSYGAQAMMIDERNWKTTTDFLSGYTIIVSSPTEIGVRDQDRKLCFVAPTEKPGPLRISTTACRARSKELDSHAAGALTPAFVLVDPMKKLFTEVWGLDHDTPSDTDGSKYSTFGGGGNGYHVYRIGKSHKLLITIDHDPC